MELSDRKRAILETIVRAYIKTGEPVGSKILTSLMENAPSSATLRNEMSELGQLGFLEQPHISAGRVPTENAYRLFVKSLMKPTALNESTKAYIDRLLYEKASEPEQLHSAVADILSALTGLTAFSYSLSDSDITVKKIEVMPLSRKTVIMFLVTSDSRSLSRVTRLGEVLSTELSDTLKEIFEKRIRRKPLKELTKAYLQNVIASAGFDSFAVMPLLTAVFDMAAEISEPKLTVSGEAAMYNAFDEDKARRVLSLLEKHEPFINVCENYDDETKVIFGNDTPFGDFKDTASVVCRFTSLGKYCGRIGIIGSDRMSYEEIIPGIEYIKDRLSAIMTQVQKDMED